MIVVGYPGIGKSTLAGRDHKYIDLESSCFLVDGERDDNWYIPYCNIAEDLSRQGYVVFVSSHMSVRGRLSASLENVVAVYPSIDLKDAWIAKLTERYQESHSDKDHKALMNVVDYYEEQVHNMSVDGGIPYKLALIGIDYDLEASLVHLMNTEKIR